MVAFLKGKKTWWQQVIRWVLIVVLVFTAIFLILENNLSQVILDMAYADAYALAVDAINTAVAKVMSSGITYDDLVKIQTNSQGLVTMLQANTVRMNDIATQTAMSARTILQDNDQVVYIPLGAALGMHFLAGSGPYIPVKILPVGAVSTQFITEFESAGINQTRHKIFLSVRTTVRLVIPTGAKQVDVTSQVSIAESIIVGDVPESFVDVNDKADLLNLAP